MSKDVNYQRQPDAFDDNDNYNDDYDDNDDIHGTYCILDKNIDANVAITAYTI
jgi:hypothetical protein